MANYWFRSLTTGEKVEATSVQAISRLAQREANKWGAQVQVHTGTAGRKSHRKMSMARNPALGLPPKSWRRAAAQSRLWGARAYDAYERGDRKRGEEYEQRSMDYGNIAKRLFQKERNFTRNPDPGDLLDHTRRMMDERARQATHMAHRMNDDYFPKAKAKAATATGKGYVVNATKGKQVASHRLASKAQADKVADAYREQGYSVAVRAANPSKRARTPAAKARKSNAAKRGAYLCYREGGTERRIKFANKGLASIAAKDYRAGGYAGVRIIGA